MPSFQPHDGNPAPKLWAGAGGGVENCVSPILSRNNLNLLLPFDNATQFFRLRNQMFIRSRRRLRHLKRRDDNILHHPHLEAQLDAVQIKESLLDDPRPLWLHNFLLQNARFHTEYEPIAFDEAGMSVFQQGRDIALVAIQALEQILPALMHLSRGIERRAAGGA